jgi:hypothetical protein
MKLDRAELKPVPQMNGGADIVLRRQVLGPAVFYTPWAYVDHLIVQRGAGIGTRRMADMSEAYYVLSGDGSLTVDGETVAIKVGGRDPGRSWPGRHCATGADGGRHCPGHENEGCVCGGGGKRELTALSCCPGDRMREHALSRSWRQRHPILEDQPAGRIGPWGRRCAI